MRKLLSMAMVVGLVGCHRTPQVEPRPLRQVGDYAFRMNIGAVPVTGEFSIEKDTVALEAAEHSCRRTLQTGLREEPLKHSFDCGGGPTFFRVVVDSKQPTLSSWFSTGSPRTKKEQVCDRYTTNKDGERVCAASRTVVVSVTEPISGRLEVTRIAATDKP
jgi:hypothetical protein